MMKRCLLLTALVAQAAFGADLYVATDGVDDDASGRGSDATPYKTLEYAYSKAADAGDRILLKTGTHTLAKQTKETKLVIDKAVTITSVTGKPEDVILTRSSQRLIKLANAEAVLAGVTLHGGTSGDTAVSDDTYDYDGVGALITGGVVSNCVIRNASYGSNGRGRAAVALNGANAKLIDCVVSNNTCNTSGSRGPVEMRSGLVKGCVVCDNTMERSDFTVGGGSGNFTGGTVEDCVFTRNRCRQIAGVRSKGATVRNCVIWDNRINGLVDEAHVGDVYDGTTADFSGCTARIAINGTCTATTDPGRYGSLMKPVAGLNFTVSATRFIVPKKVTFTATNGSAPYQWDFDGDGTVDKTTETAETTYEYTTPGRHTPKLTCGSVTRDRPGLVEAMGTKMYVKKNNDKAKFPYADETTAAATPMAAADACVDGQEIVIKDATYPTPSTVSIGRAVTVRSDSGNRDGVILNAGDNTVNIRALHVEHPQATVHTLTALGCGGQIKGGIVYELAGVVSNCVFRKGKANGHSARSNVEIAGDTSLMTHCWITNSTITSSGVTSSSALFMSDGARVSNCLIADNEEKTTSTTLSAGVRVAGGVLENCTVVGNKAGACGGVYASGGVVTNCVIVGNTSLKSGAGYHDVDATYAANYDHCVTEDVDLCGTNDQDAPANLFASYATKDFIPAVGSKLADKGVETAWTAAKDLAGTNRVMGAAIDIGCYERPAAEFEVSFTTDVLEGFSPLEVTFTASAKGTGASGGTVWYYWDFDGDDIYEVKTNETTLVKTLVAGNPTVSLIASNATSGVVSEAFVKPAAVNVVPKILHVVKDNPKASFPYDCEENAAKDIPTAYEAAIDGCTILLHPTEHPLKQMITLSKAVTIRGTTGNPADVAVKYDGTPYDGFKFLFALNNANALVADLTLTRGQYDVGRAYVGDEPMGGTVSNCIVRGYTAGGTWALAPVWLTSAKSLITHCLLTNNTALTSGPDASLEDASCGGIRLFGGARAENCLVANCTATNQACGVGGILAHNGKVVNCTVVNCRGKYVGGIANTTSGSVTNCVAACCTTTGDAANSNVPADAALRDKFSHCATDTIVSDGWVCATTNELFRNFAAGDYRPRKHGSPLYKAGADVPAIAVGTDLLGKPRGADEKLDIGCYKVYNRGLMMLVR